MRSEYFGQHFKKRQLIIAVFLFAAILTVTGLPAASHGAEKNYSSATYRLTNISVDKASQQLAALGLSAEIKKFEKSNTIVVTTDSIANKVKVASVLGLIDSTMEYEVTKLSSGTDTKDAPSTVLLNAAIKGIEVGSFAKPPVAQKAPKAIIDIHGQDLISIAPKGLSRPIIAKLTALQTAQKIRRQALEKEQKAEAEKAEKLKAEADKAAREKAAQELKLKIEKDAKEKEAKASITPVVNNNAILRLTEANRTGKTSSKPEPPVAEKSIGVDLSTLSPTMRQFKEAQKQLAEALKSAEADSVNKFMANEKNAKQITQLAKNDNIDSGLLELIKESQRKAKEKDAVAAEKAKATNTPKTEPQKTVPAKTEPVKTVPAKDVSEKTVPANDVPAKTNPVVKSPTTGANPSGKRPVTPSKEKTVSKAPAAKVEPTKITATPKTVTPGTVTPKNQPPKKDNMADIMQMIQAMNANRSVNTGNPKTPDAKDAVKPGNIVKPNNIAKSDEAQPKPSAETTEVKKTTSSTKLPAKLSDQELETTINLPTKVQITKLLELVGMELGLNYMYDPAQVTGEVMLFIHDGGKIKVRELYSTVESVLKFKGFVMTRNANSNLVTVVRQGQAMDIDTDIFGEDEAVDGIGNVIVTKIFKVKHVDTETAQKMLTDMKLGISIQSIPEYGKMIITGYAYRMNRIQEVIDLVDLPGKKKEFRYRMLTYLTPSELAPKIEILAKELGTVSISISSETAQAAAAAPVDTSKMSAAERRTYLIEQSRLKREAASRTSSSKTSSSTIGAATSKSVYLDIDDRTNRILMIGLSESIDVVDGLIDILDVKQQGIMVIRQYKIEFVDAAMLIDILSELGITDGGARPISPAPPVRGRPSTPTTTRGESSGDGPKISLLIDTNSLLVNATYEKHEEIMAIIAHVDVLNPDERTIKEYEIKHVDTQEILDTLTELGITSALSKNSSNSKYGSQSRYGSPQGRQPAGSTSKTPTANTTPTISTSFSEPLADEPEIAVLETTNSLLINATAKQHASIEMVIKYVDRETTRNSTPYVIYPLENQDPEKLKPILDELVNATIQANTGTKSSSGTGTTPNKIITQPKTSGGRDEDDKITIVSDPATYSLVVYASKKNQLWIGNLVTELDAYRPQVLLDVTLVEVSKNDEFSYDVNLLSSIPTLAGASTSGLTGTLSGDITAQSLVAKLMDNGQKGFTDYQANAGNFTGFYGNKKIMALFHVMEKKNYGRILAKPKLLVDDNQEGTIETKNTVYVTRLTTSSQSVNNGDPIQTQNTEFDPYDALISLKIKPHISKGENLRLEITLSRSDFVELDKSSPVPPEQATSDITTVATVPNNHTIILGGMDRINQSKGGSKVPILGDLPFIGGLFRSAGNSSSQKKLYVFVKAHILRPGETLKGNTDLVDISRKHRIEFEKYEGEMQKYKDWPGIKPQPMDPLQILETDEYIESTESMDAKAGVKTDKKKPYIEIEL